MLTSASALFIIFLILKVLKKPMVSLMRCCSGPPPRSDAGRREEEKAAVGGADGAWRHLLRLWRQRGAPLRHMHAARPPQAPRDVQVPVPPGIQCCGSGMFIPDPDFYPFLIPDPKTAIKERGEKKLFVKPFFVATNFSKLKIIKFFKCRRIKFGSVFKEL
jgi:hypothetical protein